MKQSRSTSLIKSCVSTGVGFGVAFLANMIVMPYFGLQLSHSANLLLTTIYTVISIARGYLLERAFEAMGWRIRMSAFALAVLAERQRQITHEGYDQHHDAEHQPIELASAAAAYFYNSEMLWPWHDGFKPDGKDRRRDLVRGCALGLAAGELFDRNRKRKNRGRDILQALDAADLSRGDCYYHPVQGGYTAPAGKVPATPVTDSGVRVSGNTK